jgi:hypothetical protein
LEVWLAASSELVTRAVGWAHVRPSVLCGVISVVAEFMIRMQLAGHTYDLQCCVANTLIHGDTGKRGLPEREEHRTLGLRANRMVGC